jgi:MFS family permease
MGRKTWLMIGTGFFTIMPFFYNFVDTPQNLMILRLFHGTATAIYGPVSLAYVSEISANRISERFGWFSIARNLGYIIGPLIGGLLILWMTPTTVISITGFISAIAFLPFFFLSTKTHPLQKKLKIKFPLIFSIPRKIFSSRYWDLTTILTISVNTLFIMVKYSIKTFLPIYAYAHGLNPLTIGLFFSIQETTTLTMSPFAGKLGDIISFHKAIIIGLLIIGLSLNGLNTHSLIILFGCSILIGITQALFSTNITAIITKKFNHDFIGMNLGILGSAKNSGKVLGPIIIGILIKTFDFGILLSATSIIFIILGLLWTSYLVLKNIYILSNLN